MNRLRKFLRNPNLVVWGYGDIGKELIQLGKLTGMQIVGCVDSSVEKQGRIIEYGESEYIIDAPPMLCNPRENYHVIVTPQNSRAIIQFLEENGYTRGKYICLSHKEFSLIL